MNSTNWVGYCIRCACVCVCVSLLSPTECYSFLVVLGSSGSSLTFPLRRMKKQLHKFSHFAELILYAFLLDHCFCWI